MRRWLLLVVVALAFAGTVHGQDEPALSEAEVEILRDRAADPPARVQAFIGFLDDRTKAVDKLNGLKRRPGKTLDLHDMMEQFTSIASDFDDNLEEYGKKHKDVRKVLPRVLAACERWTTALKSPPEDTAYDVARTLALEAVAELRDSAKELIEDQKAWFLAHPPPKNDNGYEVNPKHGQG